MKPMKPATPTVPSNIASLNTPLTLPVAIIDQYSQD
jgi:hypothetical protein